MIHEETVANLTIPKNIIKTDGGISAMETEEQKTVVRIAKATTL